MAKTQTKKNNNSRRMANCSLISGKLFLLSIILILPYIVNYAPTKETSYNASFATNKDLKRLLAEPTGDLGNNSNSQVSLNTIGGSQVSLNTIGGSQVSLNTIGGSQVSLNNAPENVEHNLENNSEHAVEEDEEDVVEHVIGNAGQVVEEDDEEDDEEEDEEDDDDGVLSDADSCLVSESDSDVESDPDSSLESESEHELDDDDLAQADQSSMNLGARSKIFRKSVQHGNASHRRDDDSDDDEEDQVEENDMELDGQMSQLLMNIHPQEIQKMIYNSYNLNKHLCDIENIMSHLLANDKDDPEQRAKLDARVNAIDNMLKGLIKDFNLSEPIQHTMAEIEAVAQQVQQDASSVDPEKMAHIVSTLTASIVQSQLDEHGNIDSDKVAAHANELKERVGQIFEEVQKPL
ncbi:Plasmodium exported protein, unknown function [Plasmodium chabaudi chabaudi]|uniref:Uncharacterized protein n=1 Tax=Plasmodium chabaudi chabaudi TaxID=31271 RepID=A0A077TJQ2_PLACU|nr:Plasmodium exported protein, unknown function [Plasmodium chabaudi chabaudi]SCM18955.1 Plasmodium exported protein, unknown function [Plasmodium chabaudi chabaudi]SCN58562.1 Plasmodium exported protein, unknown function [Plasmodium chabaudi chabaudi]VTZ66194.1 Plasmodium exported protein, unknown function [Plasmodium chabaudi chabaudi]|eukprot:XP_016652964.1 Plasmodium exported protein, unknown function [Plasmodium chabaudi chabaudi]